MSVHETSIDRDLNKFMLTSETLNRALRIDNFKPVSVYQTMHDKLEKSNNVGAVVPEPNSSYNTNTGIKTTTHMPIPTPIPMSKSPPTNASINPVDKMTDFSSSFFIPKEKDGLFWCFYIIKYGFSAYEYPGATSFVNEKDEKFKLIEMLREKKQILKSKKIKNIKEEVENDLANKPKIGMKTFIALCIAENINILFIHKRKCFELLCDGGDPSVYHIIHWHENPEKYCYEMNATKEVVDKYKNTLFAWESLEKPLKAISSYKMEELQEICKKLGLEKKVENLQKKNKKDLYELVLMNL